jgi:archaetidylinositol phosphate synthase
MEADMDAHVRVNTGVLAAVEKRVLVWMAERLPRRVTSDHLTLLALVSMAGAGGAFWLARHWPPALLLVVVALALNWLGDSLDGTLARVRKQERPRYGFYVDHVLDITGISLLLAGVALSGYMSPVVAFATLAAYLLVSAEVFLATAVGREFRMSFLNVGPTELRLLLAAGTLTLFWRTHVTPPGLGSFMLFDAGGVVAVAGLLAALVTAVVRNTVVLYRAEPVPAPGGAHPTAAATRQPLGGTTARERA